MQQFLGVSRRGSAPLYAPQKIWRNYLISFVGLAAKSTKVRRANVLGMGVGPADKCAARSRSRKKLTAAIARYVKDVRASAFELIPEGPSWKFSLSLPDRSLQKPDRCEINRRRIKQYSNYGTVKFPTTPRLPVSLRRTMVANLTFYSRHQHERFQEPPGRREGSFDVTQGPKAKQASNIQRA